MNLSEITNGLNDKQCQSVTLNNEKNALILAGAGSGKTKVLIHRIAYLITQKDIHIDAILAVTFTNKAATEMCERLSKLLRHPITSMWTGTFHSLAHRLLRTHYEQAQLTYNFQILDAQDQFRIIKNLMKENNIDESKFPIKKVQQFINNQKNKGIHLHDIDSSYNYFIKKSLKVFELYEVHCKTNELIDFAELLIRSYELLKNNVNLLNHYKNRFKHILIDEFQDTNMIQYKWIKLLFSGNNKVFCVGDDDQSIYGWRGANIENITKLCTDFVPIKTIRLEQNYRSTNNILTASNALIAHNTSRMGKSLWTNAIDGELIDMYEAQTEIDEADYVVSSIQKLITNGVLPNDCAILYRLNTQSRIFEEVLIKYNIPYIIYGGLKFFERAEIKHALSYLRLIENSDDNLAFERVVNFPTRGIGNTTINKIRIFAQNNHVSLFQATIQVSSTLSTRTTNALNGFTNLIEKMKDDTKNLNLSEKIVNLLNMSGLMAHYSNDKTSNKKENLEELITAAKQYKQNNDMNEIIGFISLASIDSGGNTNTLTNQNVQLMTMHSAKGLEFPYVFLSGMEEGLSPYRQSKNKPHLIDEERRLCYVGMTRAMKKLSLSYTMKRFLHGHFLYADPSRFLNEIPDEYLNKIKVKFDITIKNYNNNNIFNQSITPKSDNQLHIGALVNHPKFGLGTVLNFEGQGDSSRIQIKFKQAGSIKWLISSYANLEFI
ncbi:UvrD-helicase domain-containing protein [Candidatus Vesicomyidisocius calyptogenae]|uniref:DNA 3'-5' helicase n=1 Tax=Vesicomyosocius okutanii subsp. Calyptogena okutanii (strain HA) TaxID=412965 RepID=A5CX79_VESOH|nr:UvrD-helicase domain-containing protein [Candidatus Vesicomyosocius okutanii]BAF61428.1 DNA helicase II / ATP-dependent DNA helicase PcrA [Candidatus Vesicomyosocius okutanii]